MHLHPAFEGKNAEAQVGRREDDRACCAYEGVPEVEEVDGSGLEDFTRSTYSRYTGKVPPQWRGTVWAGLGQSYTAAEGEAHHPVVEHFKQIKDEATKRVTFGGRTFKQEDLQKELNAIVNKGPESVLQEAERIINGERAKDYGDSIYNDFKTIGELWSVVLNTRHGTSVVVSSDDVAMMMLLLKVSRSIKNTTHRDSLVDIAGYAGCAAKLRGIDQ